MKHVIFGASICAALASQTVAQTAITVSCYRGPWQQVIWDKPNQVFVNTLMQAGYSVSTATGIAESLCRDESLVNNPRAMTERVRYILDTYPRDGRAYTF